jgi:hypothetical protein
MFLSFFVINFSLFSGSQQYKIVCSFNLIRSLLDGKHVSNTQYVFDYLETVRKDLVFKY